MIKPTFDDMTGPRPAGPASQFDDLIGPSPVAKTEAVQGLAALASSGQAGGTLHPADFFEVTPCVDFWHLRVFRNGEEVMTGLYPFTDEASSFEAYNDAFADGQWYD
jgi:hypothetical protein